jgi:hypothetical protein
MTNRDDPGLVRIRDAEGRAVASEKLLSRGLGVAGDVTVHVQDLTHASPQPTGEGGRRTMYVTHYPPTLEIAQRITDQEAWTDRGIAFRMPSWYRDLIEQVLFTSPGERVNRPGFGTGLQQLLFAPNSDELATATQFLVQGALQQWLGDLIQVQAVQVDNQNEKLSVTVQYVIRRNRQQQVAQFTQPGGQP